MLARLMGLRVLALSAFMLCSIQNVVAADLNVELQSAVVVPNNDVNVKALIDKGADVTTRAGNPWNTTPLMFAATLAGNVKTVNVLLEAAKKLGDQKFKEYVNAQDNYGNTALLLERQRSKDPAIEAVLIAAGATDAQPAGSTEVKTGATQTSAVVVQATGDTTDAKALATDFIAKVKQFIKDDKPFSITEIPGLDKIQIDQNFKTNVLDKIVIQRPKLETTDKAYIITGGAQIGTLPIDMKIIYGTKTLQLSDFVIGFTIPGTLNFNQIFPELNNLVSQLIAKAPEPFRKGAEGLHDVVNKLVEMIQYSGIGVKIVVGKLYEDPEWGRTLYQGINLNLAVDIGGKLGEILKYIGIGKSELYGSLDPRIIGSHITYSPPGFKFNIPTEKLKIPGQIKTLGFTLWITLEDIAPAWAGGIIKLPVPSVAIETGIELPIPDQPDPITLNARCKAFVDRFEILGYGKGIINNFFGIRGLRVGNLGFGFTMDYMALINTLNTAVASCAASLGLGCLIALIPPVRGIQGSFSLGLGTGPDAPTVTMRAKAEQSDSKGLADVGYIGNFEGVLSLDKMLAFPAGLVDQAAELVGQKIDTRKIIIDALPKGLDLSFVELRDTEIRIMPKITEITGTYYDAGIGFSSKATFLGKRGYIYVNLNWDILKNPKKPSFMELLNIFGAEGYIESFNVGPIKISGEGKGGVQGPNFKFILGLPPKLYLDGMVELDIFGGIKSKTHIDISWKGLDFKVENKLANLFDMVTIISARITDIKAPKEIYVKSYMKQSALKELERFMTTAAQENLAKAQNDVVVAQNQAKGKIDEWVNSEKAKSQAFIDEQQRKIDGLIAESNRRIGECEALRNTPRKLEVQICKDNWAQWPKAEIPGIQILIAGAKVHKDVTLEALRTGGKVGTDIGMDVAKAAINLAQKSVDLAKQMVNVVPNIQLVSIEGNLDDLIKQGTLPKVNFEADFNIPGYGIRHISLHDIQFNFKDPLQLARDVIAQLSGKIATTVSLTTPATIVPVTAVGGGILGGQVDRIVREAIFAPYRARWEEIAGFITAPEKWAPYWVRTKELIDADPTLLNAREPAGSASLYDLAKSVGNTAAIDYLALRMRQVEETARFAPWRARWEELAGLVSDPNKWTQNFGRIVAIVNPDSKILSIREPVGNATVADVARSSGNTAAVSFLDGRWLYDFEPTVKNNWSTAVKLATDVANWSTNRKPLSDLLNANPQLLAARDPEGSDLRIIAASFNPQAVASIDFEKYRTLWNKCAELLVDKSQWSSNKQIFTDMVNRDRAILLAREPVAGANLLDIAKKQDNQEAVTTITELMK